MKKLFNICLNFLLPETILENRLKNISIEEFYKKAGPSAHPRLSYVVSFFSYKEPLLKDMIWAFKYKGKKELSKHFATVMHDFILEEDVDENLLGTFSNPLLVPIPISSSRKQERGYNQAELIANDISKLSQNCFVVLTDVLHKKHTKEHQARTKQKGSRKKNIIGSLYIKNSEKIENKNIILIDDVITTGSTIEEARKVLLQAGAKEVRALTVAH